MQTSVTGKDAESACAFNLASGESLVMEDGLNEGEASRTSQELAISNLWANVETN